MVGQLQHKSLFGREFGVGRKSGEFYSHGIQITRPAVDALITVSAEGATTTNTRDITIQLKDAKGANINYAEQFEIITFLSSAMVDFMVTGGSTGIQQGASGKLLAVVAKKLFRAITTTSGLWAGSYLDSGTEAGYLGIRLPSGRIIGGGVITCA